MATSQPDGEHTDSAPTPTTVRHSRRVLQTVGGIFAILVAIEIALRLPLSPALGRLTEVAPDAQGVLVEDPYVLRRTIPSYHPKDRSAPNSWLRTNSLGFRAPEIPEEKPEGTKRIFCLGGSALFGATSLNGDFLSVDKTYPGRLEATLNDRRGRWEVYNAGMLGQTSLQGLRILQRDILPLQPDVVVASYFWNDIRPATDGIPDANHPIQPAWLFRSRQWLHRHWFTGRAIIAVRQMRQDWLLERTGPPVLTGPQTQRVPPDHYAANLVALTRLCSAEGIYLIIMTPPVGPIQLLAQSSADIEGFQSSFWRYQDIAQSVTGTWGIAYADGDSWLSRQPEFFNAAEMGDLVHFNAAGHEQIAIGLANIVWEEFRHDLQ